MCNERDIDDERSRRAHCASEALKEAEKVREALSDATGSRLGAAGALSETRAVELIDEVRAGRERG